MKERVCERVRFREKERAFDKKGKGVKRTREREREGLSAGAVAACLSPDTSEISLIPGN